MDNLLEFQIKESCKLALPNGLKELMTDISREVLRAQPKDIYNFVADYLSALLIARENLTIASRVCSEVCDGICHLDLHEELLNIGLSVDEAESAKTIILEYFRIGKGNLLMKLMKKMYIDEELLPAIQDVVRKAFLRHRANNTVSLEYISTKDMEGALKAAAYTLQKYSKQVTPNEEYNKPAKTVQEFDEESVSPVRCHKISISTISSTSLAGSFLKLPKYKPYSALDADVVHELEESFGKEYTFTDYTEGVRKRENVKIDEEKIIVEEFCNDEVDETEESVEEVIEVHSHYDDDEYGFVEEVDEIQAIDDFNDETDSLVSIDSV